MFVANGIGIFALFNVVIGFDKANEQRKYVAVRLSLARSDQYSG